ncbi:MAG: lysophospholipid acyltransferase family protein [Gemmatimonadales bacterium]
MTAAPGAVSLAPAPAPATPASLLRLVLVPAWTAASIVAALVARLVPDGGGLRRRVVRGWARGVTRILRLRVERSGPPPSAPFLLVSNHLSYLDIIVLASEVDAVFVAKREVRAWPLFGLGARAIGCVFVDRDSRGDAVRAGALMRRRYAGGEGVVLFAEGTSSIGATVLPLRSALLEWAASEGLAVHTATLSYHTTPGDPPASEALCWWGEMTFLPHLAGVTRLNPSTVRLAFGDRAVSASDRKQLARALHAALLADFRPSGTP